MIFLVHIELVNVQRKVDELEVGISEVNAITTVTPTTTAVETVEEAVEVEQPSEPVVKEVVQTNTYRITAYCSCEKCCGKWALNRPLDSNGQPIVRGASGETLVAGVSVASPLPFGTNIELKDYGTVVVHDRTADWVVEKHGQNILDLYFSDHQKAVEWGVKYLEGAIVE